MNTTFSPEIRYTNCDNSFTGFNFPSRNRILPEGGKPRSSSYFLTIIISNIFIIYHSQTKSYLLSCPFGRNIYLLLKPDNTVKPIQSFFFPINIAMCLI